MLSRANKTLEKVLLTLNQSNIPVYKSWKLNELHYGELTGLTYDEAVLKYGEKNLFNWKNVSRDKQCDLKLHTPPMMDQAHPYHNCICDDSRYKSCPKIPLGESVSMGFERVTEFWKKSVVPQARKSNQILLVAHADIIRCLIMFMKNVSYKETRKVEIPNASIMIFEVEKKSGKCWEI